jgi:alkyl hydroperoxide reductase subunit F
MSRGVQFEDRDVTRDRQALRDLIGKYGSQTTPTFVIDEEVVVGFDTRRLDELLGPIDA